MRFLAPWSFALVVACSSTPQPKLASFRPSEVRELAALPAGYRSGATLAESCSLAPRLSGFNDETLASVDCSEERLSRVLRARAGELSGRFIVGKSCHAHGRTRGRVECSAKLAVAGPSVLGIDPHGVGSDPGPAPTAAEVQDLDEPRPQDGQQIRVAYAPTALGARGDYAARRYDAVAETHEPAVGRAELGQVSARCAACDAMLLRYALRVTAGHVGAGEVAAVKCFQDVDGQRCVATALAPWKS